MVSDFYPLAQSRDVTFDFSGGQNRQYCNPALISRSYMHLYFYINIFYKT